jgi:hypothetical protein
MSRPVKSRLSNKQLIGPNPPPLRGFRIVDCFGDVFHQMSRMFEVVNVMICGALTQGPKFIARISMIVMQSRLWLGHSSRGQEALKALIETRASYLGEEALIAHR